jgi:hypothetical protein
LLSWRTLGRTTLSGKGTDQIYYGSIETVAKCQVFELKKIIYFRKTQFFFLCPGHIIQYFPVQALYPEPCTRPYEIRIYRHSSVLRAILITCYLLTFLSSDDMLSFMLSDKTQYGVSVREIWTYCLRTKCYLMTYPFY